MPIKARASAPKNINKINSLAQNRYAVPKRWTASNNLSDPKKIIAISLLIAIYIK